MNRKDGVRTLEDIRQRCRIDEMTGCWVWGGATVRQNGGAPTTRVWLPQIDGSKQTVMTAHRAAAVLAGMPVAKGLTVWAKPGCERLCCNPGHLKIGERGEMMRSLASDGRWKGDPKRAAANRRNRLKMVIPADVVAKAERMFDDGRLQREVMAECGITQRTARLIAAKLHPHSSSALRVVSHASVFAMANAIGGR